MALATGNSFLGLVFVIPAAALPAVILILSLNLADVYVDLDHEDGPRVHPRRKGKREREPVLVGRKTGAALAGWIQVRGEEPGPLFYRLDRARGGEPVEALSGEAVRRMVASRARQAGVKHTVRPHGLRHSSATEVAKRGSLSQLMALGSWASMSAASRYLDERNEERLAALGLVEL